MTGEGMLHGLGGGGKVLGNHASRMEHLLRFYANKGVTLEYVSTPPHNWTQDQDATAVLQAVSNRVPRLHSGVDARERS